VFFSHGSPLLRRSNARCRCKEGEWIRIGRVTNSYTERHWYSKTSAKVYQMLYGEHALNDRVSFVFNRMVGDYDDLQDLWYSWLFSRLHFLIAKYTLAHWSPSHRTVLDVGCGTGFQSFLYALTGAEVVGIDIADQLLVVAREKAAQFRTGFPCQLFPAYFNYVNEYDNRIFKVLMPRFASVSFIPPKFEFGDAVSLPYGSETYDHVNCCGSTLSYVANHSAALAEIARVLKPEGSFVLEVEAKYNMDLFWAILDAVALRGALQYDTSVREALRTAFSGTKSHATIRYPFGGPEDPVCMDLKLFERATLRKELSAQGLTVSKCCTIHSATNIIPSTILDNPQPSRFLVRIFSLLASIEERIPFALPGCSLVFFGRKEGRSRNQKRTY